MERLADNAAPKRHVIYRAIDRDRGRLLADGTLRGRHLKLNERVVERAISAESVYALVNGEHELVTTDRGGTNLLDTAVKGGSLQLNARQVRRSLKARAKVNLKGRSRLNVLARVVHADSKTATERNNAIRARNLNARNRQATRSSGRARRRASHSVKPIRGSAVGRSRTLNGRSVDSRHTQTTSSNRESSARNHRASGLTGLTGYENRELQQYFSFMLFVAPPTATPAHARRSRPTTHYSGRKHSRKQQAHPWTAQPTGGAPYTVNNRRQPRPPSNAHPHKLA